jgi:hypothetical protein
MSDKDVERVMELAFCSEEKAKEALSKTGDVVDAVDMILEIPPTRGAPKPKILTEEQKEQAKIRSSMEEIDRSIHTNLTKTSQPESSYQESQGNLAPLLEEMSLHSDYTQSSHLKVLKEEE